MNKSKFTIIAAIGVILAAVAVLIYKLGQQSGSQASWSDYDDYGWS